MKILLACLSLFALVGCCRSNPCCPAPQNCCWTPQVAPVAQPVVSQAAVPAQKTASCACQPCVCSPCQCQ